MLHRMSSFLFAWSILFSLTAHADTKIADQQDARYDQRSYRRFILDNQVKVLLISDPTIQKSSASLNVAVGSLNNPVTRPGLAHFLEHMLFLGTEKYPEAGSYQKFVSDHDGYTNAYTADDHTNYHFEIASDYLEDALDRFAQFFVAPLFNPQFVEREIHAVDSEHSKNIPNDYWRMQHVIQQVFDEKHPARLFSTGNLETLNGVTQEELVTFYKQHYSSNLMTLAISGKEDLDTLERFVRSRFSQIANHHMETFTFPSEFLKKESRFRLLRIQTIKDKRTLQLMFPLPAVEQWYKSKPLQILGYLIGHEGKGSLLSLLKKKNLATELSAGTSLSTNSYAAFTISISLSPDGMEHYQEIIIEVFRYLKLLRETELPEYMYNDVRTMSELDYKFAEKQEGSSLVSMFSALMQTIPLTDLLEAPFVYSEFEPEVFKQLLHRFTPDNMLVVISSNNQPTGMVTPYYNAHYAVETSDIDLMKTWNSLSIPTELFLPKKNPFIPQSLAILTDEAKFQLTYQSIAGLKQEGLEEGLIASAMSQLGNIWKNWSELQTGLKLDTTSAPLLKKLLIKHVMDVPEKIIETPFAEVWFQQDIHFESPKGQVFILFNTPQVYETPRHAVLSQLYAKSMMEGLNEFSYPVRMAGLDFSLSTDKKGVLLSVGGYSDKLPDLLVTISQKLKDITIDESTFQSIKEKLLREYQNFQFQATYQQAFYYRSLLLEKEKFSLFDYEKILPDLTLNDLKKYVAENLFKAYFIQELAYGNLSKTEVRQATEKIIQYLQGEPLPKENLFEEEILRVSKGSQDFVHQVSNNNSAIIMDIQTDMETPELNAAVALTGQILGPEFYNEMRTKQQLGYLLDGGMTNNNKLLGLLFIIQSGNYAPDLLLQRINKFLEAFIEQLPSLPPEQFELLKKSLINSRLQKANSVMGQASWLFDTAFEKHADFDYLSKDIRALEQISMDDLNKFLSTYLISENQRRLILLFFSKDHVSDKVPQGTIQSIQNFKKQQNNDK
ncbi:MAG: insulinase family protein [SAR324 cluster bacterium]|nr:insulinase family protein [SAR324 cluster bacterium]